MKDTASTVTGARMDSPLILVNLHKTAVVKVNSYLTYLMFLNIYNRLSAMRPQTVDHHTDS